MKKFFLLASICVPMILNGQKPALDHSVYDRWKSFEQTLISDDAKWTLFTIIPQQGDGWMYICNNTSGKIDSVERGSSAVISPDSKYIAYMVSPAYSATRQAKKKKLKEDQLPKNDLEIRILSTNEVRKISKVKSFSIPEEKSYWMAYLCEKKIPEKGSDKQSADSSVNSKLNLKKPSKPPEPKGSDLVILNPLENKEYKFGNVTEYVVSKAGKSVIFIQDLADTAKTDNFKISIFETSSETTKTIFEARGVAKKLSSDKSGKLSAFLYSADTTKRKLYELWLSKSFGQAVKIIDTLNTSLPVGWSISESGNILFSDDAKHLYFGTGPKPLKEKKDTLLDEEKYKLDIWSWDDEMLQPMQKKQLEQEQKRSYQAVYLLNTNIMYQIADTGMPNVRIDTKKSMAYALGNSDRKYQKFSSWESRNYADYYLASLEKGTREKILTAFPGAVNISPAGRYLVAWYPDEQQYKILLLSGEVRRTIKIPANYPLFDELNDTPDDPAPYGIAGWTENDSNLLFYDRYDIWSIKAEGKEAPVNITNGYGRKNNIRFRYIKLNRDQEFVDSTDPLLLSAFNLFTKEAGFYSVRAFCNCDPVRLIYGKASFPGAVSKAKNSKKIIWQKESYNLSPELYLGDSDFSNIRRLSVSNPEQSHYNWLTAELVEWTSFDGQELQGILYKPEDFDLAKKYPMIVYFYERSSDGLYRYFPPAPSASIINRTFAVSNGYLLFVPDIVYKIGYPGESCYNAVVSGTYALINKYSFIDRDRLGLDGQSWGGYQVAWLVTQTDLFRCAYAGAPVSNMISAYGGIRWETGMSRMFQYEHTQSRIGGTLWDKPLYFIENSPIFFVPKINTPLLLMHNDADGAVPWYQGIEFFTALRRLDKPAWLLSYNDEAHNLVKRPNKKDLSIRKMQFFDHYLKGAEMPHWMKYGISQTEKGKIDGYNFDSGN